MEVHIRLRENEEEKTFALSAPFDLSIPVSFKDDALTAWYLGPPEIEPHKEGDFVGAVRAGSPHRRRVGPSGMFRGPDRPRDRLAAHRQLAVAVRSSWRRRGRSTRGHPARRRYGCATAVRALWRPCIRCG